MQILDPCQGSAGGQCPPRTRRASPARSPRPAPPPATGTRPRLVFAIGRIRLLFGARYQLILSMEPAATGASVRLSLRCLARAADLAAKDFTFVVGEREYACSRFQACFISAKVCGVLACDATADRFCVCGCKDDGAFGHVMYLANGADVAVTGPRIAVPSGDRVLARGRRPAVGAGLVIERRQRGPCAAG